MADDEDSAKDPAVEPPRPSMAEIEALKAAAAVRSQLEESRLRLDAPKEEEESAAAQLPAEDRSAPASSNLEDTITDPLSGAEREALTQVRQHEAAVRKLRDDFLTLRARSGSAKSGISIAELRGLAGDASRLEALLGVPREVLSRKALAQVEWPAADLELATIVIAAVDSFEAATQRARVCISSAESAEDAAAEPSGICEVLEELLNSWSALRKAEQEARSYQALNVDMGIELRAGTARPLSDALLDLAVETYRKLTRKAQSAGGDLDSTLPPEGAVGLAVFTERCRAFIMREEIRDVLDDLQVDIPNHALFQESCAFTCPMVEPVKTDDDLEATIPVKRITEAEAALSAVTKGIEETTGTSPSHSQASGGLDQSCKSVDDALSRTAPMAVGSSMLRTGSQGDNYSGGTKELWHAVHVGDLSTIQKLIDEKACDAKMRDLSGHSVLWHAVAFNHYRIANLMLDTFPPGTEEGVDLTEVHFRKGDTLLHLLCQSNPFGTETALVFKRIATVLPVALLQKVNHQGVTFVQIAAASLNFWVLTFILRNFDHQSKALLCKVDQAPLKSVAKAVILPAPPAFTPPAPLPEHLAFAKLLQPDDTGAVPYADVAFDVGLEKTAGRFLAHRLVVVAQSPVLFQELEKLPLTELPRQKTWAAVFRVDPRISQEVWRTALQFMYTGVLTCAFSDQAGKVVELLRACVLYKLPAPLLGFAQACLYPLLPSSPPEVALQVFSICAGSAAAADPSLRSAREASMYIILRSAHVLFDDFDSREAAQILERVVQAAERSVFDKAEANSNNASNGGGGKANALPAGVQDAMSESLRGSTHAALMQSAMRQAAAAAPLGSGYVNGCAAAAAYGGGGYPGVMQRPPPQLGVTTGSTGALAYGRGWA